LVKADHEVITREDNRRHQVERVAFAVHDVDELHAIVVQLAHLNDKVDPPL
jgi:hypothetical protein